MKWLDRKIDSFIQRVRDKSCKECIGSPEDPKWWRFLVIPRNRFFNIYLHNFFRDDAEDLHDHRMVNVSIILQGWYFDERFISAPIEGSPLPRTLQFPVHALRPVFRLAGTPHRVVLYRDFENKPISVWSLFIGFPHIRNWGFWKSEDGKAMWIPHDKYLADVDPLSAGYGRPKNG